MKPVELILVRSSECVIVLISMCRCSLQIFWSCAVYEDMLGTRMCIRMYIYVCVSFMIMRE